MGSYFIKRFWIFFVGCNYQIENDIAQIEKEGVAARPQMEELELEINKLNNQIQTLNKQQRVLQSDINNLKQEDVSIVDKVCFLGIYR